MSKEFLFVLWAGGGNVPPQLELARQLVARKHHVRMLAPAVLREKIESAGIAFEAYRAIPEHDESVAERSIIRDFEARSKMAALAAARDNLVGAMVQPVAADVLAALERRHADVVAFDYLLFGGLFGAEKASVPAAMLIHTVYPFPAPGMPPYGMGWKPMGGPLGRVREAAGHMLFHRLYERPLLPRFNEARVSVGLDPVHSFEELLRHAERALVMTSPAFDVAARLPTNVQYVGPQLATASPVSTWSSPWPDEDDRPLVVTSLSTTHQSQDTLVERIVEALGALPVRALVTATGGASLPPRLPSNVRVSGFVPHGELLPHASAVVTHAGLGTVHAALAYGVPLVCLPVGRDQPDNAARVEWHGAGLRLSPKASPAAIGKAVNRVLREPSFAASARRLASTFREERAAQRAVTALEAAAGDTACDPVDATVTGSQAFSADRSPSPAVLASPARQ